MPCSFREEIKSAKKELIDGRCKLKIVENVYTLAECDWSTAVEARQTIEHRLDLYIGMNEDLTWELKAAHYKFSEFLKGARTRSIMDEASIVATKFSMGTQMQNLMVPTGVNAMTQTKAPVEGAQSCNREFLVHRWETCLAGMVHRPSPPAKL